ncbi:hypothetical protein LINGRAHAP2_LOCUS11869 [Linum grandiflorum]
MTRRVWRPAIAARGSVRRFGSSSGWSLVGPRWTLLPCWRRRFVTSSS